jgi:hypothetical protein
MAQVSNTDYGYIVKEWFILPPEAHKRWHSLRNFGDRQSDAKEFAEDVKELKDSSLNFLAKNFNPDVKYKRISSKVFRKEK